MNSKRRMCWGIAILLACFFWIASPRVVSAATGLDFPSNAERTDEDIRLQWIGSALQSQYPMTLVWRVKQSLQDTYFTNMFWSTKDEPFDGATNFCFGAHPYPNWSDGGTRYWEIATEGTDYVSAGPVVFDAWYTQIARATLDGNEVVLEYWPEWPSATNKVVRRVSKTYADTPSAIPALTLGDSPWWQQYGHERTNGIMRGLQFYNASLSEADIASEIASPLSSSGGASAIWYLNLNPTPTDVLDDSGNGHNPTWASASRPDLYAIAPVISSVASSTSATSATITWTTDEAATSTVEYGTDASYGSATSSVVLETSHSIRITGLDDSTHYHFRVKSQNAVGYVATSDDYAMMTPDGTNPVISSVASSTSATSATITWTTDEATTSTVEYGMTTGYGSTTSSVALETGHSIVIESLTSNTLYHFRVSSQDASGNATTTGDYVFRTTDVTSPTITAFVIPSTSDSLMISISSFTATDDAAVTGYFVSESDATPSVDDAEWEASSQSAYTFSSEGSKILYAFAKDAAGNISDASSASVAVALAASVSNTTQPQGGTSYVSPYLPGYQYWDPDTGTMIYGSSSGSSSPPLFVERPSNTPEAQTALQSRLSFLSSINLPEGSLVKLKDDGNPKTQEDTTVYYIGSDGRRHVFPNGKIYGTWFQDFSNISVISLSDLASIPLGSNIVYKPGIRMIKFLSDPKCYSVESNGVLRWVPTEDLARSLYGDNWNTKIDDLSDAFYGNYTFGGEVIAE